MPFFGRARRPGSVISPDGSKDDPGAAGNTRMEVRNTAARLSTLSFLDAPAETSAKEEEGGDPDASSTRLTPKSAATPSSAGKPNGIFASTSSGASAASVGRLVGAGDDDAKAEDDEQDELHVQRFFDMMKGKKTAQERLSHARRFARKRVEDTIDDLSGEGKRGRNLKVNEPSMEFVDSSVHEQRQREIIDARDDAEHWSDFCGEALSTTKKSTAGGNEAVAERASRISTVSLIDGVAGVEGDLSFRSKVYMAVLSAVLYPVDLTRRRYLDSFREDDFQVIRQFFGIDDDDAHDAALQEAQGAAHLLISVLGQRTMRLDEAAAIPGPKKKPGEELTVESHRLVRTRETMSPEGFEQFHRQFAKDISRTTKRLKSESSFTGALKVTVLGGQDLAIKDQDTKSSDPYCKLTLRNTRTGKRVMSSLVSSKTSVQWRTLDPVWLEDFTFDLDQDQIEDCCLTVKVFDKDKLSRDDFMGRLDIPLKSLKHQRETTEWYDLKDTKDVIAERALAAEDRDGKQSPSDKKKKGGLHIPKIKSVLKSPKQARKSRDHHVSGELQLKLQVQSRQRAKADRGVKLPSNEELYSFYECVVRSAVMSRLRRRKKRVLGEALDAEKRAELAGAAAVEVQTADAAGYLNPYCIALLDDLAERYGIPRSWHAVCLLRVFTENFVCEHTFLARTTAALAECEALLGNDAISSSGGAVAAVPGLKKEELCAVSTQEEEIVDTCVEKLRKKCDEILLSYPDSFEGEEMDGSLAGVLTLRGYIAIWREQAKPKDLRVMCTRFIEHNARSQWHNNFSQVSDDFSLGDLTEHLTAQLALDLCVFEPEFRAFDAKVCVFETAAGFYSDKLYFAAADQMLKWTQGLDSTDPARVRALTEKVFTLYFAVQEFNDLLAKNLEDADGHNHKDVSLIPLNNVFGPFLTDWRERSRDRLTVFLNRALASETWRPLADGLEEAEGADEKTQALIKAVSGTTVTITSDTLHSTSVADLFALLTEAIRFLLMFSETAQKQNINLFVSRALLHVLEAYTNSVRSGFLRQTRDDEESGGGIDWDALMKVTDGKYDEQGLTRVSVEQCVRVNNVYAVQFETISVIDRLEKKLCNGKVRGGDETTPEELDNWFQPAKGQTKSALEVMLNSLVSQIDQDIQPAIGLALHISQSSSKHGAREASVLPVAGDDEGEAERRLKALFGYLDAQLSVLNYSLYPGLFRTVLQQLFVCVISSFERFLLPCVSKVHFMYQHNEKHKQSHGTSRSHAARHLITHSVQIGSRSALRGIVVQQSTLAVNLLDRICEFFHADGEGLKSQYMDDYVVPLKRSLALFQLDPGDLERIYISQQKIVERMTGDEMGTDNDFKIDIFEDQQKFKEASKRQAYPLFHILSALAAWVGESDDARKFVIDNAGKVRNAFLVEAFGCAPDEELFGTFPCRCEQAAGNMYLTTLSLCFDPILGGSSMDKKNKRFRLPFESVVSVTKYRGLAHLPTGLRVRMRDESDYGFSSLLERSKCLDLIKKAGPHIEIVNQRTTDGLGGDITDAKNDLFRKRFGDKLPRSENLLRSIDCSYNYFPPGQAGHLQISENYVTFYSLVTPRVIIAFADITAISKAKGRGFSIGQDNGLEIGTNDKVFKFHGLSQRDVVHQSLVQMWQARRG